MIEWSVAKSVDSTNLLIYFLEGATLSITDLVRATEMINVTWSALYNGTANHWNVPSDMHRTYVFRVRAKNNYGFGNWSRISEKIDLGDMTRAIVMAQEHIGLILGLSIPAFAVIFFCFCYFVCRKFFFFLRILLF